MHPASLATVTVLPVTVGEHTAPTRAETPPAPHRGAPPGPRRRAGRIALGVAALAVGAAVLSGCGSAAGSTGSQVTCSGADCRAVVSGAGVEVSEPGTSDSGSTTRTTTRNGKRTTVTEKRSSSGRDAVDFTVATISPGSVAISDDGVVTTVPVGGTFVEDGSTVRVLSADGRTAVFTFRR